ncbi:MAG: site-specific integrase [Ruminococcaceae bacterium]|nr:site-specific integrase [Oscillospiraceae bacterium]
MKKLKQKKVPVRQLDGTYKRKSIYGYTGKEIDEKAKAAQDEAEAAYQTSLHPTFKSVAREWWAQHETEVAIYTADCYRKPLKDVEEYFGDCMLDEIQPLDIQRFLTGMAKQKYAKQTIKLRRIVLNMVYDYAILNGITQINPVTTVKVPKGAKTTRRELPKDEEIKIALASVSAPFGLYPVFLYYTGVRKEEALAIEIDKDIDFKNDLIIINKAVIFENNRPILKDGSKSEAGIRTVPLLRPLKDILQKQKRKGLLFPNEKGEYMSKSQFDQAYKDYRKATGITATGHQFRHAFATLCYDAGLDEKDMADIVGHADAETTKRIYVHIKEQRRKSFTDKLNSVV